MGIGEFNKAREDFNKVLELTDGKDQETIKAMHEMKEKIRQQKENEIKFSQNIVKKLGNLAPESFQQPQPQKIETGSKISSFED